MNTTCPRRMAETGPHEQREGLDSWEARGAVQVCSFCGSLHPDIFLKKAADPSYEVMPTDKNYKCYLYQAASSYAKTTARTEAEGLFRDCPESPDKRAQIAAYIADRPLLGEYIGKFYFQHLSTEQRAEFVELYNHQRMVVGPPGYFYVDPYFCRPLDDESSDVVV